MWYELKSYLLMHWLHKDFFDVKMMPCGNRWEEKIILLPTTQKSRLVQNVLTSIFNGKLWLLIRLPPAVRVNLTLTNYAFRCIRWSDKFSWKLFFKVNVNTFILCCNRETLIPKLHGKLLSYITCPIFKVCFQRRLEIRTYTIKVSLRRIYRE